MNAQKYTEQGKATPFAVRVNEPLPNTRDENTPVKFWPQFSAVLTNFEFYDGKEINPPVSIKPWDVGVMTASFYIEVWGLQKGKRKRLTETWYFSYVPKAHKTPQDCIEHILDEERKQLSQLARQRQAERPEPFFKVETAKQIDPMENAKQATLILLKRQYPSLALALDTQKPTPEASKAFIADCVRLTGCTDADVNLKDAKFVAMLADAWQAHDRRAVRKSKVDAVDWYLANPRNWAELHALPIDEITDKANKATGFDLSVGAIEKRIERLGLITPRKRGKPVGEYNFLEDDSDQRLERKKLIEEHEKRRLEFLKSNSPKEDERTWIEKTKT